MSGTDHPPSTTSPMSPRRRAITTTVALALAATVLVGLVATATGRTGLAAAAEPERASVRSHQDGQAALDRIASVAEAVAPPTTAAPTTTTTTAPPAPPTTVAAPAPQPVATGSGYNDPANPAAWDRLAQCESGGNWAANTGNGYYGGIQFSIGSWQAAGGSGRPDQASRATQIAIGQRLWHQGGWVHWPACTAKLGYR
jgi:hypothetical protein